MMFCPACGNQMHEDAVACPACGRPNSMAISAEASASWFSPAGRIPRKVYWLHYQLPLFVIPIPFGFLDGFFNLHNVLSTIVSLVLLVPNIAGSIKRAHDRGRSGWFLLLWLLPIIGWIWLFVELGFVRGTPGPNRFGPDPLRPAPRRISPG